MNPKVQIKMEHLNKLTPLGFVEDEQIKNHFISVYLQTHSGEDEDSANDFYAREAFYFRQLLNANAELQKCTMFSLYGCFLDISFNGLSFDPASTLIYITSRSVNVAPKNSPNVWEKRASNKISPYGELALRMLSGQIKYVDDPVIVYEGDTWQPGYNADGSKYMLHSTKLPRTSKKIIGSFIKITRADGSFDFPYFTEENINEWKVASAKQNKEAGANALYGTDGDINIGFLKAKTIKHAFKTYPKLKKIIGSNTELEDSEELAGFAEIPQPRQTQQPSAQLQQLAIAETTSPVAPAAIPNKPSFLRPQVAQQTSQPQMQAITNNGSVVYDDPNAPF